MKIKSWKSFTRNISDYSSESLSLKTIIAVMHLINCNSFLQFLFFVTFITIHVRCNDSQGNCLTEKPTLGKDDVS